MTVQCVSPIKAEVVRFTLLDLCGRPIRGPGSAQITTDAFTEVNNTPSYEAGQRYLQRKANGQPCVNQRDPGFFNWIEQETKLCSLDPDLIAAVTGEPIIEDFTEDSAGEHTGVIFGEGLLQNHFSKELWQPVAGEGACDASGAQRFVYWAFPHEIDAQIQAFNFVNDVFNFGFKSITKAAHADWDLGDPWLAGGPVSVWGPGKHYAFNITTVAPPEPGCGALELNET